MTFLQVPSVTDPLLTAGACSQSSEDDRDLRLASLRAELARLSREIETYKRVNLEDVIVRKVDSSEGPLESEKVYTLSMAPDRFAGSDRFGHLDVQFPGGNLAPEFLSAWDQKGKDFEQDLKICSRQLVQNGVCKEEDVEAPRDIGQGHRVIFDTDNHYRRLCGVCTSVLQEIVDVSCTMNFMWDLHSNPNCGPHKLYADMSGDVFYANPKFWYCVCSLLGIFLWLARSLGMTHSVIMNDKDYHRNFYSDPLRWSLLCGYSKSCGILWICATKEIPAIFCNCQKSAQQEKEWRAFTLWCSIFFLCLFGVPRDVTDIITILHPEKAQARAWPCHKMVEPEGGFQSDVRMVHRIWQYWFPGELWEYNFENLAMSRNRRSLIVTKLSKIGINMFLFATVHPTFGALAAFGATCLSMIGKLQSVRGWNAKASQFKKQQYEDLKDPNKKGKAERNLRLYWL